MSVTATVGDRERIGAWADFVYTRRGQIAHVLPFDMRPAYPSALCGRALKWLEDWYGTGSQKEIDRARSMPLCARCVQLSKGRTR